MEESEKRRERLRAMRMEAAAEVVSTSSSSSSQQTLNSVIPPPLTNPLLENEDSYAATPPPPRFDFYTDPMAAYSADKRRIGQPSSTPRPHFPPSPSGPRNPEMPLSGVHPFQNNYAPHQGTHQGRDPFYSPVPTTSTMGNRSPYPVHQGSSLFNSAPGRGHWFNNSPSPGSGQGGSPYPVYQGSPNFRSPQGRGHWSNNTPSPGSARGGGPSPGVGRGRGRWEGSRMSPVSRYSGGRGRGYNNDVQARSFYNKSMVEDPWVSLTPIIWKGENDVSSSLNNRGSFQKTPSAKKARVSDPFDVSNSKQSLAEFLAASFDEAVQDTAAL